MNEETGVRDLSRTLGFRVVEASSDHVEIKWEATLDHYQPYGVVHGGVHCAAIESAAGIGAALWLGDRGRVVSTSNRTDFIRTSRFGIFTAVATPVDRTGLRQLWQVEIRDELERLVARGDVWLHNEVFSLGAGVTDATGGVSVS